MWGHLIAWKTAGVVIALVPALRQRIGHPEPDIDLPVLDLVPEDHPADRPAECPAVDVETALDQFYAAWMSEAPGESIAFAWVRSAYAQMAPDRGWPAIADKTLSIGLVARGCERRKRDARRSGGGRPTMIVWPPDYSDAEPSHLARAA